MPTPRLFESAACALVLLAASVDAQRAPLFQGLRVPLRDMAGDVALGDLDGDARPELLVTSLADGVVGVFGRSVTAFEHLADVAVGVTPTGLSVLDLDGDGRADVVTANRGSDDVSVLIGKGDGTFAPAESIRVDVGPVALDAGDVDGNGTLDLVVACADSGRVTVLLGEGDGTFGLPSSVLVGGQPADISLARLDDDAFLDLVVTDLQAAGGIALLGDGVGGFIFSSTIVGPQSTRRQAVADVDGDGLNDVLLAGCGVFLSRGLGDGSFAPHELIVLSPITCGFLVPNMPALVVDDWSADGIPDIVLTNLLDTNVAFLQGVGDGSFVEISNLGTFQQTFFAQFGTEIAAGDLYGDGTLGLALLNPTTQDVGLLRVPPSGDLGVSRSMAGSLPGALALGDLNGDGALDVVTGNQAFMSFPPSGQIHFGAGDGTFASVQLLASAEYQEMLVDRIDDDGKPDLVTLVVNPFDFTSRLSVMYGDGAGGFSGGASKNLGDFGLAMSAADLDDDGFKDFVVALPADLFSLLSNGAGGFGALVPLGTSGPYELGRLDGDAFPSLLVGRAPSELELWAGLGDGTFAPPTTVALPASLTDILLADMDGDQIDDVVVALGNDGVAVLPGLPGGGLAAPIQTLLDSTATWVRCAELDGDGRLDLLAGSSGEEAAVLLGNGSGGFAAIHGIGLGDSQTSAALGHMGGDRLAEIVYVQGLFPAAVIAMKNGPGLPWRGLFQGLAGTRGVPRLAGEGSLVEGGPVTLSLRDARQAADVFVILGLSEVSTPFFGGTLVPSPDVVRLFRADSAGTLLLSTHWPPGVESGATLSWQAWIPDDEAVEGVAASNALLSTVP